MLNHLAVILHMGPTLLRPLSHIEELANSKIACNLHLLLFSSDRSISPPSNLIQRSERLFLSRQ